MGFSRKKISDFKKFLWFSKIFCDFQKFFWDFQKIFWDFQKKIYKITSIDSAIKSPSITCRGPSGSWGTIKITAFFAVWNGLKLSKTRKNMNYYEFFKEFLWYFYYLFLWFFSEFLMIFSDFFYEPFYDFFLNFL